MDLIAGADECGDPGEDGGELVSGDGEVLGVDAEPQGADQAGRHRPGRQHWPGLRHLRQGGEQRRVEGLAVDGFVGEIVEAVDHVGELLEVGGGGQLLLQPPHQAVEEGGGPGVRRLGEVVGE
jgi:hypothetical protein